MWLKYGFGRGCQQISVDVRAGLLSREHALVWLADHEGVSPPYDYAGVSVYEVLARIGVSPDEMATLASRFSNGAVHAG
jgi:hypothetical protein